MRRVGRTLTLLAGVAAVAAVAAAPASGAETRAEYAAQVNPICAATNAEAERLLEQAFQDAGKDKKKAKGKKKRRRGIGVKEILREERHFFRLIRDINEVNSATLDLIATIPAAPGDESLVAAWVANRRLLLDLDLRILKLEKRFSRIFFSKRFTPKLLKKERRLDRRLERLSVEASGAARLDLEYGAQLQLTYCISGATGQLAARYRARG